MVSSLSASTTPFHTARTSIGINPSVHCLGPDPVHARPVPVRRSVSAVTERLSPGGRRSRHTTTRKVSTMQQTRPDESSADRRQRQDRPLPVWRIGLAGGLVGILCCVGPTVLALLGVVSAGTAFVW